MLTPMPGAGQSSYPRALVWTAAALLPLWAAVLLLAPTENADLYWHLYFGRWILAHGAVPRAEFLSYTMPAAPWIDFEWLYEVLLQLVHAAAGCAGLLALRAALLLAAAWLNDRTLALHR